MNTQKTDWLSNLSRDIKKTDLCKDRPVLIKYSPTIGKTMAVDMLRKMGYTVFEEHELTVVTLESGGVLRHVEIPIQS